MLRCLINKFLKKYHFFLYILKELIEFSWKQSKLFFPMPYKLYRFYRCPNLLWRKSSLSKKIYFRFFFNFWWFSVNSRRDPSKKKLIKFHKNSRRLFKKTCFYHKRLSTFFGKSVIQKSVLS